MNANQEKTVELMEEVARQYNEYSIDQGAQNLGFARELERTQTLFRELQAEFLLAMEEKRVNNEVILKGAKFKTKDIEKVTGEARAFSNGNLDNLLPRLKKTHEFSNQDLVAR